MAHLVKCYYCGEQFDRDKVEHVKANARRYGHATCMLRKAEEDSNFEKLEIIDPTDEVKCVYCKSVMSKKDETCIIVGEGKYAHEACCLLEESREKTDKEKLDEYIQKLFGTNFVEPRIQKQIAKFVNDYNYTYSGIRKALQYFFEIKSGDVEKAHNSIGM